jgi:hypothetical protein
VRRLLAVLLIGLTLAACGSPAPIVPEYDVVAEALKAFDRGDWVLAARLLREAVAKRPTDVTLHYSLGVTATHLELRDEAIQEFRWVLATAPGTPEGEAARNWLIAAGLLSATAEAATESSVPPDPDAGDSGLRGRVTWTDGEPPVKVTRMQLFLKGIPGTPTKDFQAVLRTDEDGNFEFKNVPAGEYRLSNRIAGQPVWRLRVKVPPSETVALDLTQGNSLRVRDDFPAQ